MGSAYTILGKQVPAHFISLATIGATLLVAVPNPFAAAATTPKIQASSPEEEKIFVSKDRIGLEPLRQLPVKFNSSVLWMFWTKNLMVGPFGGLDNHMYKS
ncbi:hypothetical protein WICPIJ_000483 [Wickerhamomyces pijperi]|uniref:Uncharacterized protein n=1 Tax=Wickerhamomyces pijperi TaxID=599730 RepID=A0A9P8TQT5_WICPI|nr:hypothetical protein WICPIJ_000483 [Wickerhamomyces pijperi]